ncbi:MAG TPA: HNH endonuclease signature motif containing protein [Bdellovibrionales bacterium]|nr:HNH endonuclease signature motif containing protein [Bdellovibrionales bacterium]
MKFTNENAAKFTDEMIRTRMKVLFKVEQSAAKEIINLIVEFERRQLHLKMGYPTLFAWLTEGVGYAAGSAQRRIESARLLRSLPKMKDEIEAKLESGALNLTKLAQLQTVIRQEEKRTQTKIDGSKKAELLAAIENKSSAESERLLATEFPDVAKLKESKKAVSGDVTLYSVPMNEEQVQILQRIKELLSHSHPGATVAEIFEMVGREFIQRHDPMLKEPRVQSRDKKSVSAAETNGRRIYLSIDLKRQIWRRDEARCTYCDPATGKRCGARFGLEIDHILPLAQGGSNDARNLRVLCRAHNQYAAVQRFGRGRMKSFIQTLQ